MSSSPAIAGGTAIRPRRSALYLPASNARAIEKARGLDCDVVILDLEDAVAPDAKVAARAAAVEAVRDGGFGHPELVVRADPDLIMAGERSGSEIARRPGWTSLRAVRGQRVCVFNAQEVDILVRPGPRMPEAARLMARCVMKTPPEPPAASSPTGGQRQ